MTSSTDKLAEAAKLRDAARVLENRGEKWMSGYLRHKADEFALEAEADRRKAEE